MAVRIPTTAEDTAREAIFDAVRFLAPDLAEKVLRDCAEAVKSVADDYDKRLTAAICNGTY